MLTASLLDADAEPTADLDYYLVDGNDSAQGIGPGYSRQSYILMLNDSLKNEVSVASEVLVQKSNAGNPATEPSFFLADTILLQGGERQR